MIANKRFWGRTTFAVVVVVLICVCVCVCVLKYPFFSEVTVIQMVA